MTILVSFPDSFPPVSSDILAEMIRKRAEAVGFKPDIKSTLGIQLGSIHVTPFNWTIALKSKSPVRSDPAGLWEHFLHLRFPTLSRGDQPHAGFNFSAQLVPEWTESGKRARQSNERSVLKNFGLLLFSFVCVFVIALFSVAASDFIWLIPPAATFLMWRMIKLGSFGFLYLPN